MPKRKYQIKLKAPMTNRLPPGAVGLSRFVILSADAIETKNLGAGGDPSLCSG